MTDRERAAAIFESFSGRLNDLQRELLTDAVLEFAANEVETCATDPTFRAEELRSQIGAKR